MPVQFKFDSDKTVAVLTYLASRNVPDLTKGKLCKLVFLSDKYHLVRYSRPITGDQYFAVENGPIPSATLRELDALEEGDNKELCEILILDKKYAYPRISAKETFGIENLSESDRMALDRTIEKFGKMTWLQLSALTHELPAYKKAWEARDDSKRASMMFEDFFEEDDDGITGAFDEMVENDVLNKVFQAG